MAATVVLRPDLTIASASAEYVHARLLGRHAYVGESIFDVFPDNPHDFAANGVAILRASLETVLRERRIDRMPRQRHDIRDYVGCEGAWVERHWLSFTEPMFDEVGRVAHLLHTIVDVTLGVELLRWVDETTVVIGEHRATLALIATELDTREATLRAAHVRIDALVDDGDVAALAAMHHDLGAPDERRYWEPEQTAPVGGVYEVFHSCSTRASKMRVEADARFDSCPRCGDRVMYRLHRRTVGW